jgi:CRISPR-associated protein Cmr6
MLAVLHPVETALTARRGCDSWNLHLDKLSFQRGEGADAAKADALRRVVESWRDKSHVHLRDACERRVSWLDRLASQHGNRFCRVTLTGESRLLIHLGRANVLENVGLYCDRTTGLPMIPGTALKGVLSTWAAWEANLTGEGGFNQGDALLRHRCQFNSLDAQCILGDDSINGSNHSGLVAFVGGFPAEPSKLPRLEQDIVTPHPDNGRGRILPNVFLSWAPDTVWHFVFFLRPGVGEGSALLAQAERWLIEALTTTGIGAKTAAGYGRFRLPTADEKERIRQFGEERLATSRKRQKDEEAHARRKQLPPEERAYEEYLANQKDWVAAARDVSVKPEEERQWILRYFRSDAGQALLKTWTNDKGKKRIETLRKAGL